MEIIGARLLGIWMYHNLRVHIEEPSREGKNKIRTIQIVRKVLRVLKNGTHIWLKAGREKERKIRIIFIEKKWYLMSTLKKYIDFCKM